MGRKPIRRNYYNNSDAKLQAKIMRGFKTGLTLSAAITALILISFIFMFGYDFLTQCNYFKAEELTVSGANILSKTQVLKQARIDKGMNILSLNLATARKRLLTHPWIAEAEVSRELPSTMHIRITEHKPMAVIDLGRRFLINTSGEIFKEVSASDPGNLPVISGLEFSDIHVKGQDPSMPFDAVINVLQLAQTPESVLPISFIKRIQVDRDIGLTIYAPDFESGLIKAIKIGYHDYPSKYAGLKDVLVYLKKRPEFSQLESIDLNNLNRIVVQPARIESATIPKNERDGFNFSAMTEKGKRT
ncbi:MAG: FtsQ-type POTRA domain-containing protein [Desulfobacterales bacterium]|uniref:FtsQ-type POTRA domain-containing protein n=1 Tax=Candidatus Desulfatibia profunda TaxID=2841695 RepID=A0A8J6NTT6_9BACT|nr:FtsQ-type POTRA domain-containing protein [Candidatus Desulfatibia profunda]MBL7178716.1 FtsQ-type POTRA domain-containing protein [Desulfobacterales bacterium]